MILLIDNYDSFSYNLYQLLGALNPDIRVIRNDETTAEALCDKGTPNHIVLSPGPGYPKDAAICLDVVRRYGGQIPLLGVCLGHQAICEAFGATVSHAKTLVHGKASDMTLDADCPLFEGLPPVIRAARYHSLAARTETLPAALKVSARAEDGEVMGVWKPGAEVYGVQFHPESILTPEGGRILENFLRRRIL
ncbi:MAG: aminodeoxychorismate/anthranilate synthase component II [Oscillospiraceae bacterium]|jgi:anthranilate synthase component 2|nr:aminodeoxychorismate/anthranilate synthase component II [Oscillospiraceae bacterium]